jgi:Uma2 family endonuclease
MATATPERIEIAIETPTPLVEREGLYEVVDGQIVEKPPMGAFEYELASLLGRWIGEFAAANRLGRGLVEMLFDLRPVVNRQRRPDVAFLSAGRYPLQRRAPRAAAWTIVPDLAVEIVSPTDLATEVLGKVEEYFQAGVRVVWVVYPDQFKVYAYTSPVAVRILDLDGELVGGDVLPGFRLAVRELFGVIEEAAPDASGDQIATDGENP